MGEGQAAETLRATLNPPPPPPNSSTVPYPPRTSLPPTTPHPGQQTVMGKGQAEEAAQAPATHAWRNANALRKGHHHDARRGETASLSTAVRLVVTSPFYPYAPLLPPPARASPQRCRTICALPSLVYDPFPCTPFFPLNLFRPAPPARLPVPETQPAPEPEPTLLSKDRHPPRHLYSAPHGRWRRPSRRPTPSF
jgi:hypothetical protein